MLNGKYFRWLFLTGLFLFFLVAILFISQEILERKEENFWENEIKKVKIGKNIFQVEVAATSTKRKQGLSGRRDLCENCAMLFIFKEKGRQDFWMKEMNFDLDIIWIDNDKIVYITKNASRKKELEIIRSKNEVDRVLEVNAGLTDKLGIKIGDKIEF